jgi:hypothetical protein
MSRRIRARRLHQGLSNSQRHLGIVGYTRRVTFRLQRTIRWKARKDFSYTEKFAWRTERIAVSKTKETAGSASQ